MKINPSLPTVVVIDIAYSGYGIIRSLSPYGIPLIAFSRYESHFENHTRLTQRIIKYHALDDVLLSQMVALSQSLEQKPVLIMSTDNHVDFVLNHFETINAHYHLVYPEIKTVELLMDKIQFAEYAKSINILVPRSHNIFVLKDLDAVKDFAFPIILKPFVKSEKWQHSDLDKTYILNTWNELKELYMSIMEIEQKFIVQEFIPGMDEQIYYCLCYYGKDGECKIAFTGRKIRQWTVLSGSTASTRPVEDEFVMNETIRIFNQVGLKGFGSIEYKLHPGNGKYYLMEPTVGRLNLQEYVATLSGKNIPLAGYNDATGLMIPAKEKPNKNVVYIDTISEFYSFKTYYLEYGLSIREWWKSLRGEKHFRHISTSDPKVAWKAFYLVTRRTLGFIIKELILRKTPRKIN